MVVTAGRGSENGFKLVYLGGARIWSLFWALGSPPSAPILFYVHQRKNQIINMLASVMRCELCCPNRRDKSRHPFLDHLRVQDDINQMLQFSVCVLRQPY
eukprot:7767873-Pyramimonas_sp.AAC.1